MKAKSPANAGKNVTDTCPTCGCMVEVVGDVTKHYKPLTPQVIHQDTLQDMKEGKHNHILAPGFEHLPYDAPEAGIATDHTIVENQPAVSSLSKAKAIEVFLKWMHEEMGWEISDSQYIRTPEGVLHDFKLSDEFAAIYFLAPAVSEGEIEEIADMIETYFKKWNGKGFDKPSPLERQKFEACAEAIASLNVQGEEKNINDADFWFDIFNHRYPDEVSKILDDG
ncbi:MAG TPA: hypothetical protein ENH82_18710 [bacterium]|nr:hypothetical protein [bacterium]